MRRLCWWLPIWALMVCPAAAQTADPVGPFVVDVRGLMLALPTSAGWTPADLPDGTEVPSRAFGLDVGAHLYAGRLGAARLGLGATLGLGRGTSKPGVAEVPEVIGRVTTLAPQVSLNFGHRLGWSYLSAGYGGARVESEAGASSTSPAGVVKSGWVGAVNFGGGARWFLNDHVGFGFDARWHRLSGREATTTMAAAPRATLFQLALGISLQ